MSAARVYLEFDVRLDDWRSHTAAQDRGADVGYNGLLACG